jgi:hypothetical protein
MGQIYQLKVYKSSEQKSANRNPGHKISMVEFTCMQHSLAEIKF